MSDEYAQDTTDDRLEGDEVYCPRCGGTFSPLLDQCPDDGGRLIRWQARQDPLAGTVLDGRYQIGGPIGEGAMAVVYRGTQLSNGRPVAVKVIREHLGQDRSAAKRFLREARLLMGFDHPNIVRVYDVGQTESGALYLVMEMLPGDTLANELERVGHFAPYRACQVGIQLCDALAAAHGRGIVHRDLKPSNIVIVSDMVKVVDFGLAKSFTDDRITTTTVTEAGQIMGTPLYMAPEAVAGTLSDPRSDLYALGCILYELLCGEAPFADPAINVVLARHLSAPPPTLPRNVPWSLRKLVQALLAKTPEERPETQAVRALLVAVRDNPNELERTIDRDLDETPTLIRDPEADGLQTLAETPRGRREGRGTGPAAVFALRPPSIDDMDVDTLAGPTVPVDTGRDSRAPIAEMPTDGPFQTAWVPTRRARGPVITLVVLSFVLVLLIIALVVRMQGV